MTDHNSTPTSYCNHYPNRVLQKRDLAAELGGVCERTVDNLVKAGMLPQPCRLNSIAVWMLYDIHAAISAAAANSQTDETAVEITSTRRKKNANGTAHKAGKYSV